MNERVRKRLRRGATVGAALLDGAMVTALAVGLAARHVRPEVALWPQAVALAVPALTVGAASAGVWWTVRAVRSPRHRRAAWAVAVAHLGLASVGLVREAGGRAQGGGEPVMTVLSLNVGQPPPGASVRLGEILDEVEPDVVALQETRLRTEPVPEVAGGMVVAAEPTVQPVLSRSSYVTVLPETPTRTFLREPVFARSEVASRREALLGEGDEAGVFSRTEVVWQGHRVAVYSLHLRSFGPARPWVPPDRFSVRRWLWALDSFRDDMARRAREAERFRMVLDAETLPYLVLGDFNSTPHQWTYHHIAAGHTDALRVAGPLFARTFPDSFPLVRIDGVLVSPHWRIRSARVGPGGISDHRGVVAEVTLVPSAAGERP